MASPSGWHRKRTTAADRARKAEYNRRDHKTERARRVAANTPTSPCTYCRRPLGLNRSAWHLAHTPDRRGYEPGLSCADCNRREAARRGALVANARRKQGRRRLPVSVTALRW